MMPAGIYYIGDLSYVLGEEVWDEVTDLIYEGSTPLRGEFALSDGRQFAVFPTEFGGGVYRSNFGFEHGVDSGTIGCILLSDIDANELGAALDRGSIREFLVPFFAHSSGGLIVFGDVQIDTARY